MAKPKQPIMTTVISAIAGSFDIWIDDAAGYTENVMSIKGVTSVFVTSKTRLTAVADRRYDVGEVAGEVNDLLSSITTIPDVFKGE